MGNGRHQQVIHKIREWPVNLGEVLSLIHWEKAPMKTRTQCISPDRWARILNVLM